MATSIIVSLKGCHTQISYDNVLWYYIQIAYSFDFRGFRRAFKIWFDKGARTNKCAPWETQ